ncbi:MAG: hypothetical protein QME90_00785 [Thermodesulfobacteriota bacterium]|nr:hypothetical protein [Thermodesulfobacteriota bacterium]
MSFTIFYRRPLFHSLQLQILFVVSLLLISSIPSPLLALGLTVQPATFLFRDIPIGTKVKLPVPLSIHNKDKQPHTYAVSPYSPSRLGMSWPEGYQEIPDPTWFRFEEKEITIAGGETGFVNMFIEIARSDAYYNQKWVIALRVTTRVESGESIAIAVYPRFLIETENREEIKGRPAGKTGIRPGVLYLSPPFHEKKESIEIYNNDNIPHTYTIRSEIPPSGIQSQVLPTPSYDWIPNPAWIVPDQDAVEVESGEKQSISFHLDITQNESLPLQRWEGLLFFRPDKGPSTFGRVLISP